MTSSHQKSPKRESSSDHTDKSDRSDRSDKKDRSSCSDTSSLSDCSSHECFNLNCSNVNPCSAPQPAGANVIPGSGTLVEYPTWPDTEPEPDEDQTYFGISSSEIYPRAYPHLTAAGSHNIVVAGSLSDLSLLSQVNFINGDLVIQDPSNGLTGCTNSCIANSGLTPKNDLDDIFPCLLGINGSLYIIGTHFNKITGFNKLRYVTGNIYIINNPNLCIMPSFPSLLNVGGQVYSTTDPAYDRDLGTPTTNPANQFVDANGNVGVSPSYAVGVTGDATLVLNSQCGGGNIIISLNAALRCISGFEALRQVAGDIIIDTNACLGKICGFVHLYAANRIAISNNVKLTKIIGFVHIGVINTGLYIMGNNTDDEFDLVIEAFVSLESVENLVIIGNDLLKVLKLESLSEVDEFIIRSNADLEELCVSVRNIGDIYVENNSKLRRLFLPFLCEVDGGININNNCNLYTIDSFCEIKHIGGAITIANNGQLVEIKGFDKLKYIGRNCAQYNFNTPATCCSSCPFTPINWTGYSAGCSGGIVEPSSTIGAYYDTQLDNCEYFLPVEFFSLVGNAKPYCGLTITDDDTPSTVNYSIVIFGNQRLREIVGFEHLKHIAANLYIIDNVNLHSIHAFGQLAFALDVWIRNNPSIAKIHGFNNLLAIRDFVLTQTTHLADFDGLKSLEYAQRIILDSKTTRAIKLPRCPIPSVLGYDLYYSFCNK